MLGKLFKYDFKDSLRQFLPLWGALLAMSLLNGLSGKLLPETSSAAGTVQSLSGIVVFALFVAIAALSISVILSRFYAGLLGEGGYLYFSLPVTANQHLASKYITAMVMAIGCSATALASGFILLAFQEEGFLSGFTGFLKDMLQAFQRYPKSGLLAAEVMVIALLTLSCIILRFYTAMAIGHLFNNHRKAWSIIAYVLMGWAKDLILVLLVNISDSIAAVVDLNLRGGEKLLDYSSSFAGGAVILLLLAAGAVMWLLTEYILRNKLNLN